MHDTSNIVALKGRLGTQVIWEDRLCGLEYEHYETSIRTARKSGTIDIANIIIPERLERQAQALISRQAAGGEIPVMCIGKLQTLKDWESGRVFLYVLADFIEVIAGDYWEDENEVKIEMAELGKKPIYRATPRGKYIADATIKVKNEIRPQCFCYIPTIFWEHAASIINQHNEGDTISITGRLQSRPYTKKVDEVMEEIRIAYELSVNTLLNTMHKA